MNTIDFHYLYEVSIKLFPFALKMIAMAIGSLPIALTIGLMLAIIMHFKGFHYLRPFAKLYISFFRGTPLLIQLFVIYFGLPQIFPWIGEIHAFIIAMVGIALNSAAYMSEAIRGAFIGVNEGQMEASFSIGMTQRQAIFRIILPQAARIALPALFSCFIDILKGTSLAFTISVLGLVSKAMFESAVTFRFFECYIVVALYYWAIVTIFQRLYNILSNYVNRAYIGDNND